MKRQQQKSGKSVAFLTLPLTEQQRMQSLRMLLPCFLYFLFFPRLVSHDYRIKISTATASILIFHQQLEEFILSTHTNIDMYRRTYKIYALYTGWSEVKLVKRITVLSWQPLIKDHLNNRRPTARISHSHPHHSASPASSTFLLFSVIVSGNLHREK